MRSAIGEQTHLAPQEQINLGSFYTPSFLVQMAYDLLKPHIDPASYTLLDSSCGYGSFLRVKGFRRLIGMDIDEGAIRKARACCTEFGPLLLHQNALCNATRKNFSLLESDKLLIVGNPPYNDKTSLVRYAFKQNQSDERDSQLKARDVGISFLRSFAQLRADFVCVLHPLSYLIKESNFKALKDFRADYCLIDSVIVSSRVFCPKSKGHFPIILALYRRGGRTSQAPNLSRGMDFEYIYHYRFRTLEGKSFALSDFDFIGRYVDKYPNQKRVGDAQKVAMFYTLRDINALRRSKTFLTTPSSQAINITPEKYSLYCYIDVFKRYIAHIPYYFGNCDILIDYAKFRALESIFVQVSEAFRHKQCCEPNPQITQYFKELLGEHYEAKTH